MLKYIGAVSPNLKSLSHFSDPDVNNFGGPVFVQLGEQVTLKTIDHDPSSPGYRST